MNMIVCVKQVIDPEAPPATFKIDAATRKATMVGAAPVIDQVALGIELEHVRRRRAAVGLDRVGRCADLGTLVERVATVDDVNVIPRVDPDADRRAEDPVIGQRLRPERVDLEHRGIVQRALRAAEDDQCCHYGTRRV